MTLTAAAALLAGCSMVPDYERPTTAIPASWDGAGQTDAKAVADYAQWWARFSSPELDTLMAEALANNQDVAAALATIEQARGTLRSTNSSLLPQLNGSGSASQTQSDPGSLSRSASGKLTVSYALDLWGEYRAKSQSAEESFNASVFDTEATRLLVQSNVASTYFTVLSLKDRIAYAKESLKLARETLQLVELRNKEGLDSGITLAQQRNNLATVEASLPSLEQSLVAAKTSLAILLGRAPEGFDVAAKGLEDVALPEIAPAQPSTLLERRPDIRRAEANLKAANADIGAARAAFFPSLDLSASLSRTATYGLTPVDAGSIAGSLLAPIFSAGNLEGSLQTAEARKVQLVATYRGTVLTSLKEVEDALSLTDTSARRQTALAT
ncbi:MAG: RND transporter, partial [Parvibaculum sp.]|nr:RND transporter [Parvibaculum sp.]